MALNRIELLTLLAMLRLGDKAYGVTIYEEIQRIAGTDVSMAGVYSAVDRLERRGLVRPWRSEPRPERGGRARRHYDLTDAGRELVRQAAGGVVPPEPFQGGDRRREVFGESARLHEPDVVEPLAVAVSNRSQGFAKEPAGHRGPDLELDLRRELGERREDRRRPSGVSEAVRRDEGDQPAHRASLRSRLSEPILHDRSASLDESDREFAFRRPGMRRRSRWI